MPASDGTGRLVLIFGMPGTTVAVPMTGEQWDALAELAGKARPSLGIVLAPASLDDLEATEGGGFRVGP
jgi:hypothetical protein